jgi:hypothetical protein
MSVLTNATPSITGASLTSAASIVIPAAIPLALMQGTVISDPQQIWNAGDRHTALADQAKSVQTDITQTVDRHATDDKWSSDDKTAFLETHVKPYLTALTKTADMHNGAGSSLSLLAKIYEGLGLLSFAVGSAMAWAAAAVLGVSWVPGVNATTAAAANGVAQTSNGVFRRILLKLGAALLRIGKYLRSIKNLLPALKFTAGIPLVVTGATTFGVGSSSLTGSATPDDGWSDAEQSKLQA